MACAHIGTSGYQYDHWRGSFYPNALPKKEWFAHYARHFDAVEINNTFYHLPSAETFEHWREAAPTGFCYALKFSRYGSHLKCLKDPEATVGKFLDAARRLNEYLGPVLVQLKPNWTSDLPRLRAFLETVPRDVRWAVEFRNPDWLRPEAFDLLREFNAALCVHDMLPDHPRETTADWVYLRFHGDHYHGSYSPQFLTALAGRIREHLDEGRDVHAYFNNDAEGFAVENARDLMRYLES